MKQLAIGSGLDTWLVDEVEVAVIAVDPEGLVLRWNSHAEQIYGWPSADAVGRNLVELALAPADARLARGVMAEVSAGRVWEGDFPIRRKDGTHRTVHGRIVPMYDEQDELVAMVGFSTDVTDQRREEADRARNEQELEYLARASAILDSSLDLHVTLQKLAELAVPFLGDGCMVDVLRGDGTIERFAVAAIDDSLRDGFKRLHEHPIDADGNHPIARAMRTGESQLPQRIAAEDRSTWAGGEQHKRDLDAFPGSLVMVAPIKAGERLLGTLSIAMGPERESFGDRDVALVEEMARRASTVLENARLYAERSYVAETLQQSLLPVSLPDVDCFDVAAIYRPAAGGTEVGGDFYDVFDTPAGNWCVTIADVCGKGVEAAAVTSLARHTLRAAAQHHSESGPMLCSVNAALLRQFDGSQFCTMALAVVETVGDSARVLLTLGGHPSPMVLRANGEVDLVGEAGSLLGVVPEPDLYEVEVTMNRGDALLLYTDGAIETRTERGRLGTERLMRILSRSAGRTSMEIVAGIDDAIGLRSLGDEVDDLALLALRFSG